MFLESEHLSEAENNLENIVKIVKKNFNKKVEKN